MKQAEMIIPKEFKGLFDPNFRYKAYFGGRYGLKSHSFARAALILGRQKKLRIAGIREIQRSIKDSIHKLLTDLISEYKLTDYVFNDQFIRNNVTGTEIIFKGLRDVNKSSKENIKSLEGIDLAIIDEAQSLTKDSIDILTPTIRKPGSQIWFSFNRYDKKDPVFERFCTKPNERTLVKKVNYTDFKDFFETIGQTEAYNMICQEAEDCKELNIDDYNHIWLGEPKLNKEGAVFRFNPVTSVVEGLRERILRELNNPKITRVWDFGLYPACKFYAVTPFGFRLLKELIPKNRPTLSQFIVNVQYVSNEYFNGCSFDDICDIAGKQTSHQTGKTSIDILNANGIYPEYEVVPIEDGIVNLQNLIDKPEGVLIDSECEITIEMYLGGYYRKEDKTGLGKEMPPEQVHPYEEAADCDRYLAWLRFKPQSTQQMKHKQDVYKKARVRCEEF